MTISRLSGNRVLIFLGTGDLRDYALDFSRMDASDSQEAAMVYSSVSSQGNGFPRKNSFLM